MKKCKIFIAIDTNKISKAKKIIKETQNKKIKIGYKFGLEFILSKNGRNFISKLKKKNYLHRHQGQRYSQYNEISRKIFKRSKNKLFNCSH